jgi:hypothetical protein
MEGDVEAKKRLAKTLAGIEKDEYFERVTGKSESEYFEELLKRRK